MKHKICSVHRDCSSVRDFKEATTYLSGMYLMLKIVAL